MSFFCKTEIGSPGVVIVGCFSHTCYTCNNLLPFITQIVRMIKKSGFPSPEELTTLNTI